MAKIHIAGQREFTDAIQLHVKQAPEIRIATISTDPTSTVDKIERGFEGIDALLLGFEDRRLETMADIISRNKIDIPVFVSTRNPALAYRKWQPYKFKIAPEGKELEVIARYFKDRPKDTAKEHNIFKEVEPEAKARVEIVREREEKNSIIAVNKKVVTLFGQKGGIGKTGTLVSLSQSLNTLTDMNVVVLDLDMNRDYGDVLRYFGYVGKDKENALNIDTPDWEKNIRLPAEKTLSAWVKFPFENRFDRKLVEHCLVKIRNNLYVLPPLRTIMDEKSITYEDVQKIIDTLKRNFSVVLIDGGNTLSTQTIAAIEMSDELLIMAEASMGAFDSLADFTVNTLNMVKGNYVVGLVINKMPDSCPVDPTSELPEITGGFPVIATLPEDADFRRMVNWDLKVPYLGAHDTPYTREMEKLLNHIYPKEVFGKKASASKKLFSFFKRFGGRGD